MPPGGLSLAPPQPQRNAVMITMPQKESELKESKRSFERMSVISVVEVSSRERFHHRIVRAPAFLSAPAPLAFPGATPGLTFRRKAEPEEGEPPQPARARAVAITMKEASKRIAATVSTPVGAVEERPRI
jgi:hypothetical protein